jgi:hypothetical protein
MKYKKRGDEIKKKSSPLKLLSQFQPNFLKKFLFLVTAAILNGDHPRTIPAKFALIWFSGFIREDLNVIFYQNMSNLYRDFFSQFIQFRNIMR